MIRQVWVLGLAIMIGAGSLGASPSRAAPTSSEGSQSIEEFVNQLFVDSVPFGKIRKFAENPEAIETLKNLLEDCKSGKKKGSPFCSTIVVTLGLIGDGNVEVRDAITQFIKKDQPFEFQATKDALMALGYWISITEKKNPEDQSVTQAINDLVSCITTADNGSPGHNNSNKLSSDTPHYQPGNPDRFTKTLQCDLPNTAERKHVRRSAILGLALSGSQQPKVKTTLTALLDEAEVGTSFKALIIEALDAHNRIASLGLACYYEKESKECQDNIKNQDSQNSGNPKPHQSG